MVTPPAGAAFDNVIPKVPAVDGSDALKPALTETVGASLSVMEIF